MDKLPFAASFNIDRIRAMADYIYEKDEFTTYMCFCKKGTESTASVGWSIMRVQNTSADKPNSTTFTWATGQCCYDLIADNMEEYEYSFKKF